ncbi:hypothetical protein ACLOJK_028236 [Asimina triloba]
MEEGSGEPDPGELPVGRIVARRGGCGSCPCPATVALAHCRGLGFRGLQCFTSQLMEDLAVEEQEGWGGVMPSMAAIVQALTLYEAQTIEDAVTEGLNVILGIDW